MEDCEGAADVIFLEPAHVEGMNGELYAFTLPSDWKDRPLEARPGDFPGVVPAVTATWIEVPEGEVAAMRRHAPGSSPRPTLWIANHSTLEGANQLARHRLQVNRDTYWIRNVEEHGSPATWTCDLLAARNATVDPSPAVDRLAGSKAAPGPESEVEWVFLGTLEFVDSRGRMKRALFGLGRGLTVTTGLALYVGLPIWGWVAILA